MIGFSIPWKDMGEDTGRIGQLQSMNLTGLHF